MNAMKDKRKMRFETMMELIRSFVRRVTLTDEQAALFEMKLREKYGFSDIGGKLHLSDK